MKKLTLLIMTILFYNATASESHISDYLKSRMPEGYWKGQDAVGNCSVAIKHDKQVTDDFGIFASVFELSIFSSDRQTKTSYKLNDGPKVGGRGDCPQMLTDSPNEIFVINTNIHAPCFSQYDHTNHGGLQVVFENNVKNFRIANDQGQIIKECKITLNN